MDVAGQLFETNRAPCYIADEMRKLSLTAILDVPAETAFREKKAIAVVIRQLLDRSGGAERLYCELANMLAEAGYAVTCLYYDNAEGAPFYPLRDDVERINLAEIGSSVLKATRGSRLQRRILAALTRSWFGGFLNPWLWRAVNGKFVDQLEDFYRFRRPALVISFLPPANTPALQAARRVPVPVIPTNHNVPQEDYLSRRRWDPNPYDRKLRLELLDYAARVHVLSSTFAGWFPKHLRDRVVVVPNYVSPEIRQTPPRAERDKVVLAVGRLAETKNYAVLIEAWSLIANEFPDWKVVLYGDGPLRAKLQGMAERLNVGASFILAGQHSALGEEYAKASLFCHPALFEGFGLVAAEALALQLPVVAFSDCAGVNEFVEDGVNGLLIERQAGAPALAAALKRLIGDEALRERLGANGPPSVATFTPEAYRAIWLGLVEQIAV
jgi:glycosyltransferase involved in cell wall biosynthesis